VLRAEIPRPTLTDLLELTALIAQKNLGHRGRVTTRWLQRWLESAPDAKINEDAFVVAALQGQNILLRVSSWACTSSPITTS